MPMLASSLCAGIWQALRCLASFLPVCRVCSHHFLWRADLERLQGLRLCFCFHSSQSVPQFPQRNTWFNIHTFVIFHIFSCYWLLISFHCAWRIYFCLPHFRFITLWLPNAFYSKPFLFHFSDFIWEVLILLQALKMLLAMHVVWLKMYWVPFKMFPDIASSKICIFLLWLLWFFLCLNSRTALKSPAMMLFSKPLTKNPL